MMKIFLTTLIVSVMLFASQIDMLEKACQDKSASACYELGLLYSEGIGFEQNSTQADNYYKKACDYGLNEGCQKVNFLKKVKGVL